MAGFCQLNVCQAGDASRAGSGGVTATPACQAGFDRVFIHLQSNKDDETGHVLNTENTGGFQVF